MANSKRLISNQLRDLINAKLCLPGASQRELAREAGLQEGIIGRFLDSKRGMTLDSVDKLCRYFQVELQPIPKRKKEHE